MEKLKIVEEEDVVQISRGSSVAANSGTKARNDSNHYEDQRRHQEPHNYESVMLPVRSSSIREKPIPATTSDLI